MDKLQCPYCKKYYTTYIPKGGDGTGLRLRMHYIRSPKSKPGIKVKKICRGSFVIIVSESEAQS